MISGFIKVSVAKRRLKQTVEEVSRLKNERKKIMDVSNELRSALNKVLYLQLIYKIFSSTRGN